MAKKSLSTAPQKRKPRLLWANPFCLLDTSSGASMTVRQMLHQLVKNGYEVQVLGCTIFDNPKGMGLLKDQYPDFKNSLHQLIEVEDGDLSHQLVVTARTTRNHLTTHEEGLWHSQYLYLLDSFKPDIVWFYGGQTLDLLIPDEARARGIPSAFYLANGNYKAVRWCRDIDLILTDSQSTADMYRTSRNAGFAATPVGKFIDPANFVAETHERKRLLFVNPSWQKGASVVVQLALALEQKRPDIQLEVVEARADWSAVLRETTKRLGEERATLPNVIVTPNTSDMRGPYSRARLLLAPSLWWESSGRVLAEAMLNGIPALITNRGGMPEMIGDAGIAFDFPEECYEAPHQHLLSEEQLQPLYDTVLDFYDDTALYEEYVQRAWAVGKQRHHIDQATERLTRALAPFVKLRAGNKDFTAAQQKRHRQGLASIASKPTFKVDASLLLQNQKPGRSEKSMPLVRGDFDWQIEGKIIVLDSRAKLLKMDAAENLTKTGAFGIIAFDPASEVSDLKQYEGSETTQVFQHALLGDGNPATLHTCLDASMSSTLEPLPQEELPGQYQQGSQVLTKLPINTIALDSIEGLPGLDWLILDELSDTATILEHGQQALKETLIIQARVAFQPTHKHQPSLTELQHWASRNGFRFYRFNNMSHHSLFDKEKGDHPKQASELESADALFLPKEARLENMKEEQVHKLAFMLHTVFDAQDAAYSVFIKHDETLANLYKKSITPQVNKKKFATEGHVKGVYMPQDMSPDELVRKVIPSESLNIPGSILWLTEKEKQYGGLVNNVPLHKMRKKDKRTPTQIARGGMQGGDRMSFNLHGYAIAYSAFLKPMIEAASEKSLTLVEMGILKGTGLAIWCDLFPNAKILGLDIDTEHCRKNIPNLKAAGAFQRNQPELYEFDQYEAHEDSVSRILGNRNIDIFIDDGTHERETITPTFKAMKPHLSNDFVAFIEDNTNIATEFRDLLPEYRVLRQGEMTVICPDNDKYPQRLPTLGQLAFESKIMKERLGYQPFLEHPETFNEKVVARKLYGAPKNAALLADKLQVREFVKERVGEEILTSIYQVTEDPKDINWADLPNQFVMKSNHSNGQVKIVKDKQKLDIKRAEKICRQWLNSVYGRESNEYWYQEITPKVYFEQLLETGSTPLMDYKFFIFNGCCKLIQVDQERFNNHQRLIYDQNWNLLSLRLNHKQGKHISKPKNLQKMISYAESLASNHDFMRVDLYHTKRNIFFGELTLSPGAGWEKWSTTSTKKPKDSYSIDKEIGLYW